MLPRRCSNAHQSLWTLPPSTWWAEVATPKRKSSGKHHPRRVSAVNGKGAVSSLWASPEASGPTWPCTTLDRLARRALGAVGLLGGNTASRLPGIVGAVGQRGEKFLVASDVAPVGL